MFRRTLALFSSATRSSPPTLSNDVLIAHLSKSHLPPSLARRALPHKNLYELLSSLPKDGVGARVRQRRWAAKGLDVAHDVDLKSHLARFHNHPPKKANEPNEANESNEPNEPNEPNEQQHLCYWEVTKVRLKLGGKHGKAWGRFVWRGKPITKQDSVERIPGALKYCWDSAN